MWSIVPTPEYKRSAKWHSKKRHAEYLAMLDNLDTYFQELQSGQKSLQIRHGFLHTETHGAYAIDQRGAPGKPIQTRLYIYPDTEERILYLITIGDKQSRQSDLAICRELIVGIREERNYGKEQAGNDGGG